MYKKLQALFIYKGYIKCHYVVKKFPEGKSLFLKHQLVGFHFREIQKVIDNLGHIHAAALDYPHSFKLVGIKLGVKKVLSHSLDAIYRRS